MGRRGGKLGLEWNSGCSRCGTERKSIITLNGLHLPLERDQVSRQMVRRVHGRYRNQQDGLCRKVGLMEQKQKE